MSSDHSAVSVHEHPPPSFGVPNLKLAFWLFLASDCMLFGSLIATYLSYRGKDQLFGNGPYPLDLFSVEVTTISTFDLLMSSVTMVLAVAAIQRGNMFQTRLWLALTALLGAIFVGFQ
ncbi:MAG: cytochrome oxidase subunit III, partial [Vicinamibacteria bacterium]|nr:cytochrome oxidase subunit III [Vicinamibacteria bacterium]